jgi:hypothetical protein
MTESESIVLSCASLREFVAAYNKLFSVLPPEIARRFANVMKKYSAAYGLEGAQIRMNGRTVGQILAEFQPPELNVIASGEKDGMRYTLTEEQSPPVSQTKSTASD